MVKWKALKGFDVRMILSLQKDINDFHQSIHVIGPSRPSTSWNEFGQWRVRQQVKRMIELDLEDSHWNEFLVV